MGFEPYLESGLQCLAGVTGLETMNPTCVAMLGDQGGYIGRMLEWAPIALPFTILIGAAVGVFLFRKALDIFGVDLPW